jgi:hypothetical protein
MKNIRWALLLGLIGLVSIARAQADSLALRYGATITQEDLRKHLDILASDAYEGRETGKEGQKKAARYIVDQFKSFGIPPVPQAEERGIVNGYEQSYPLEVSEPGGLSLVVDGVPKGFMQDFFFFSQKMQGDLKTDTIVFAGYGNVDRSRNDYSKVDAKGKVVLVLQEGAGGIKKGDRPTPGFFQLLSKKSAAAEAAGARVLLVVSPNAHEMMTEYAHFITTPRMRLRDDKKNDAKKPVMQTLVIDQATAELILSKGKMSWTKAVKQADKNKPRVIMCNTFISSVPNKKNVQAENVLGYVEGGDLKNELVIITAHYDHIGVSHGEVYNGADDDGSGTVAVIEMAEAFAKAKAEGHGPRRSMLFMPVSGEEKGLLGSEWYSDHPVFPLQNTVADLNIDMIGRTDSVHATSPPYVYIIGSDRLSTELHRINEAANSTYTHLALDYTFNDENDPNRFYYRSDHYNFAKHGIPIIFYFNGVHEDYHQPGDEVSKIRFDLLQQRTELVFQTAWQLANRDKRVIVDKPLPEENGR